MTIKAIDKPAKSDRTAVPRSVSGNNANSAGDQVSTTTIARKRQMPTDQSGSGSVTKQAQLLQLLSRPEGANIDDMTQATEWQQHSVRGFLAGTIKKKMGLALTSSKAEGELRRYRIVTRRGR